MVINVTGEAGALEGLHNQLSISLSGTTPDTVLSVFHALRDGFSYSNYSSFLADSCPLPSSPSTLLQQNFKGKAAPFPHPSCSTCEALAPHLPALTKCVYSSTSYNLAPSYYLFIIHLTNILQPLRPRWDLDSFILLFSLFLGLSRPHFFFPTNS